MNNIDKSLAGFFSPPIFEDDENKTAVARALHIILMILLGMIIIAFLLTLSGSVSITNRAFFTFSAIVGPGCLIILLFLLQKGYVRFAAWAFVFFQWFTTIIQVLGSDGLESPALGNFIVTILLAGFLISRRGVVIFGSLSVLSILGVWYLESRNLVPASVVFSAAAAKLVVILSGIAVATALLYMVIRRLQKALEKSQTYAAELERVTSRLEILHEIDRALLSAESLEEIATGALVRIRQLIPCPRVSVTMFNLETDQAYFLAANFNGQNIASEEVISLREYGQHIVKKLQQNKFYSTADIFLDPNATELDKKLADEQGIRSWLYLPLLAQRRLIGALNLGREAENPFTSQDAEIALDLANQLAIALQQTNLYNALQKELTERKKLIAELQDRNDELTRFTYTVSHDLRSPLVTIKGFLGMLGRDLKDNRPDKIQNDFQRIASATDKMDELLTDLLELSRIGRLVNSPVEIDSVRLIQDALDTVDSRLRSRTATVNISSELPLLYGDRTRLREVFENLIDNAVKYMGKQHEPSIEIGVRDQDGGPVFYVQDNGMGIEKRYHARIFGLFEKLDPTIEGTGIGLALVKRIIETHGGRIWVESDGLGKGSTFCLRYQVNKKRRLSE